MEPYGFIIVIVLLATGILGELMRPILRVAEYALGGGPRPLTAARNVLTAHVC